MPGKWEFRGCYIEAPYHGGAYYACRYDRTTRSVSRRSLRTADFEEAKSRLVAIVTAAPKEADQVPRSSEVATLHVLEAYLEGHAMQTRSIAYSERVAAIVAQYLRELGKPALPVSAWTPSRQLDFARWSVRQLGHRVSTIKRNLNVIGAAFGDAAKVRLRPDPVAGAEIEGSLLQSAPKMAFSVAKLAAELRLPVRVEREFVPTLGEMASFLDALDTPFANAYCILALCTWARPEAVADVRRASWDRRTGTLDLNPKGRPVTNKRRAVICVSRALAEALETLPDPPISHEGVEIGQVRSALARAAKRSGVPVRRKTFRTFMATMVRKLCPGVPREMRSVWLGHSVLEGSATTDAYEVLDPEYLRPVALATDYVICQLQKLCRFRLTAVELLLSKAELARIGATQVVENIGAAAESRTPDLSLTKVAHSNDFKRSGRISRGEKREHDTDGA